MKELNDLIQSMASEGQLDSEGDFTVSMEHAAHKLSAYRLADPALFVLNLVAAAVVGGASGFSVETTATETKFEVRKFDPEPEELERLFTYILDSEAPARLRELALALHGAQSLPEQPELSLRLYRGAGHWEGRVEGTQVHLQQVPSQGPRSGFELILTYPKKGAWAKFLGVADLANKSGNILEQLFHFCRFAPMPMHLNGRPKGSAVSLGVYNDGFIAWRCLKGVQPLRTVAPGVSHTFLHSKTVKSPSPSSMVIGLASRQAARREGILIISRGVTFRRSNELLGFPMACAAVTADHLEKNLSQADLLEDAAYHEMIDGLKSQVESLVLEVCTNPPMWAAALGRDFQVALDARYQGQETPLEVESLRRLASMERDCHSPEKLKEQVAFISELQAKSERGARRMQKDLRKALTRHITTNIISKAWLMAVEQLLSLETVGVGADQKLLVLLLFLGNKHDQARSLAASMQGEAALSPALSILLGVSETVDSRSVPAKFALFEKAVWESDHTLASILAQELDSATDTPFLTLWLGWWAHNQGDFQKAAELWERTLDVAEAREREDWWSLLWSRLIGKVPFWTQVRWQAKRGIQQLGARLNADSQSYRAPDTTVPKWAELVWGHRQAGREEQARWQFLMTFLPQLLDSRNLKVRSLSSMENELRLPPS